MNLLIKRGGAPKRVLRVSCSITFQNINISINIVMLFMYVPCCSRMYQSKTLRKSTCLKNYAFSQNHNKVSSVKAKNIQECELFRVYPGEISKRCKVGSLVCFCSDIIFHEWLRFFAVFYIMDYKKVSFLIFFSFIFFLVINILTKRETLYEEEKLILKLNNILNYFKMNSHLINLDSFIALAFSQSR